MGSQFDANYTRLRAIIILFLFMFFVYTCEVMIFGTGETEVDDLTDTGRNPYTDEPYQAPAPSIFGNLNKILGAIGHMFVLFFQILTFTLPTVPFWMTVILAPIMTIILIVAIYLVLDTIYAIVKALPLT